MIYLCIPTHNEEQTVGVVLWKVRQVMAELERDYQLLVADDASTDETPAVLDPYTRVLPLTVFRNDARRGYAASLEMLLREAVRRSEYPRRDVVIVLQADFTEEPDHIATLLRRIESGADLVVSNATRPSADSLARRGARILARLLLRRFEWPEGVHDPINGFNAYRVSVIRRAFEARPDARLLRWDGWAANAGLLFAAAPHARRVDAVETLIRRERLQRGTRFGFGPTIREIYGLVRNRERAGLVQPPGLVPAAIHSARSHERELTLEALHAAGVKRAESESEGRGRPRRHRRSRNGGGREGVKEGSKRAGRGSKRGRGRGEPPADSVSSRADESRAEKRDGPKRRKRRRGRSRSPDGEATTPVDAGGDPAASETGEAQDSAEKPGRTRRRRRGRRGGRGRRHSRQDADAQPGGPEAASEGAAEAEGSAEHGSDGQED